MIGWRAIDRGRLDQRLTGGPRSQVKEPVKIEGIVMRLVVASLLLLGLALPAEAALKNGTAAPDFTAQATLGGKEFVFSLADALKRGPVVLYFYPAAFTKGCTIEAHDFAEAIGKYKALGATVIGVSGDSIATLDKFSVSECQSKFAVAADPNRNVMKAYDSVLIPLTSYASRTSYVITPDGKVIYSYTALDPDGHVANTMNALTAWRTAHPIVEK
jgi:thioredoxin-dependent peroxiredoxin